MKLKTLYKAALIILILFSVRIGESYATVFFSCDFESGYQYTSSGSAHPGGGYFYSMGGYPSKPAGTGCSSPYANYHNTIISNDAAAKGAVPGSDYALKTPYSGDCPGEAYVRDTTIILLNGNKQEIYIRWYQKFTGPWVHSVQHKFNKFLPLGTSSDTYSTGYFKFGSGKNLFQGRIKNVGGQFNDVLNRYYVCSIFATEAGAGGQYSGVARYWDNYNNKLGPGGTDAEFYFKVDTWYCLEVHVKMNSNANTADAVLELWIDSDKVFQLTGFRWYGPSDSVISGIGNFELQHINYNRSSSDQSTYMDNIVIADEYIGPAVPNPPKNLRIKQ